MNSSLKSFASPYNPIFMKEFYVFKQKQKYAENLTDVRKINVSNFLGKSPYKNIYQKYEQ